MLDQSGLHILAFTSADCAVLLRPKFLAILRWVFKAHIASCLALGQSLFAVYILAHVIEHLVLVFLKIQSVTARAAAH